MTRRAAAVALALSLAVGACGGTATPTGSPTDGSAVPAAPTAGPSRQPRSPAATPPTILALDAGRRPSGPWAVTFQHIGTPAIREVYVLAPACDQPTCDINATIQTFDGDPIGTGVFRFADGMYRYEAEIHDTADCDDGFETVTAGVMRVSHTVLVIAGYRPAGSAVVTVDIRGTRRIETTPIEGNGCTAEALDYVANGDKTEFAAAPTPTPIAPPDPKVPTISDSFFGAGATVDTYRVRGSTTAQIVASIRANGPWSAWIHARAEALTRAVPRYRFVFAQTAGSCRIQITAKPAVTFSFRITLPAWSRPTGADRATIRWWSTELQRVATHERHHVDLYRAGAVRLSAAVADSTCANVSGHLAAIVRDINTQQCEFDLKEYGAALGLTLASCVNQ